MSSLVPTPEEITMKKVTLELRKYAAQVNIGRTTIDTMNVDMAQDFLSRSIIERFTADILTDKLVDDRYVAPYSYLVYSSPWQHFKDLHMPRWFIQRYPVKRNTKSGKVTVLFERYAQYPKANMAIPSESKVYQINLGGFHTLRDEVSSFYSDDK